MSHLLRFSFEFYILSNLEFLIRKTKNRMNSSEFSDEQTRLVSTTLMLNARHGQSEARGPHAALQRFFEVLVENFIKALLSFKT